MTRRERVTLGLGADPIHLEILPDRVRALALGRDAGPATGAHKRLQLGDARVDVAHRLGVRLVARQQGLALGARGQKLVVNRQVQILLQGDLGGDRRHFGPERRQPAVRLAKLRLDRQPLRIDGLVGTADRLAFDGEVAEVVFRQELFIGEVGVTLLTLDGVALLGQQGRCRVAEHLAAIVHVGLDDLIEDGGGGRGVLVLVG